MRITLEVSHPKRDMHCGHDTPFTGVMHMIDWRQRILACLLGVLPIAATCAQAQRLGKINHALVEAVFIEICRLQIQQPQTVIRQAILETGWMRTPFLMQRQNLFGFRNSRYLVFNHWKDSIAYYKAWQDKNYNATAHKDYAAFLKSIRYASPGYMTHLGQIQWEKPCPETPSGSDETSPAVETPSTATAND